MGCAWNMLHHHPTSLLPELLAAGGSRVFFRACSEIVQDVADVPGSFTIAESHKTEQNLCLQMRYSGSRQPASLHQPRATTPMLKLSML
jgi:hypothetical protein